MTTGSKSAFPPEDAIARLLKEAGLRQDVDRERTERVRGAVRAQWLETTRARRRRRNILRSLTALAAAASVFLMLRFSMRENLPAPAAPIVAVGALETVAGTLHVYGSPAASGDTVFTGALLETGLSARAAVRLATGASLRLDVATRVLVESPSVFTLESGAVYVDSGASDTAVAPLAIRTPLGVARDIGTQFEVRLKDGAVVVRVREGLVELSRDDRIHEASAGEELRLLPDGDLEIGSVLPYAPQWSWITRAAPPFTLEGSSLQTFLDWVSREQGWTARFEDPALEASAHTIMLEGPVLYVAPAAALRTVLPACGLTHRIENGQLWIVDAR